jgi:Ca-activated chloride channel family protein
MDRSRHASGGFRALARIRIFSILLAVAAVLPVAACTPEGDGQDGVTFHILTGSENRMLFDDPDSDDPTMMERFEEAEGVNFEPSFQGSVDTMLDIQAGAEPYDAVWPASSIWLNLGDTGNIVSRIESIMRTPVVFAVKQSKAEQLGWVGTDVTVEDILQAAESGELKYMMSSATQSNSGAMAYLGYLYAFAGQPDVLTMEMLHDPALADQTRRILGAVDRTAGASGFLRDLFLDNYDDYDGMVNNESAVITANQRLMAEGEQDLLHVIYPVDGLALADWPLGYVDREDPEKSAIFDKLMEYLLSEEVQEELLSQGRRTTEIGMTMDPADVDPAVFNPEWGIDVTRAIDPITMPAADVALEALNLYQTAFRKPSFTVLCLDFSGSMEGSGATDLKEAMRVMLDQELAAGYFLQRTGDDVTVVIPFNGEVIDTWQAAGNDAEALDTLLAKVNEQDTGGQTNIYDPMIAALDAMEGSLEGYAPAIILLTDGHSNEGSFDDFEARWREGSPEGVPVYSILFGDATEEQLVQVSELTTGDTYDGRDGLIDALRDSFANV